MMARSCESNPRHKDGGCITTKKDGRTAVKSAVKIGLGVITGIVVAALLVLRIVGFDPPYLDARTDEFGERGRTGHGALD